MERLYFGVELEFCLGYILPGMTNPDHGSNKYVEFKIPDRSLEDVLEQITARGGNKSGITPSQLRNLDNKHYRTKRIRGTFAQAAAREHIGQKFLEVGLPYQRTANPLGNIACWAIGEDTSIDSWDADPRYFWSPMEITSPALPFNVELLKAVSKVCDILAEQYLTHTNHSCSLHIHFSFGREASLDDESTRWSFESLQKLMMFFWACSPHFTALHSRDYLSNRSWALPMRTSSGLAYKLHCLNSEATED